MNKRSSFKKNLLTGISAIAFSTFASQDALATTVTLNFSAANFVSGSGDINNVGAGPVTLSSSQTMTDTSAVTLNSTGDFTFSGSNITLTGVGTGSNAIVTNGATAGTVTVGATSTLTAGNGDDAMHVNNASTLTAITNAGNFAGVGSGDGLEIVGTAIVTTITNTGTMNSGSNGYGIRLSGTSNSTNIGTINNNAGGIISSSGAGSGIGLSGTGATITALNNAGTIQSTNNPSGAIFLINGSNITTITNTGAILDTGTGIAIWFNGLSSSSIVNGSTGTISTTGAGTAIDLSNKLTGSISNTGTISTATTGIGIRVGGSITGGITNNATTGVIQSGAGGYAIKTTFAYNLGSVGISNAGTIRSTGNGTGIYVSGGALSASSTNGVIYNNGGSISATGGGYGIDIEAGLTNNSAGALIKNTGTISNTTGTAVLINSALTSYTGDAGLGGGILNTGTITTAGGIALDVEALITNNSTTTSSASIYNSNSITDTSAGTALKLAGTVDATTVTNIGSITTTGAGTAVLIGANLTGTFTNTGSVGSSGAGVGIGITSGTTTLISNAGTISTTAGVGAALGAVYVAADATITTLTNTGAINNTTTGYAVNIAGHITNLNNTGVITGTVKLGNHDTFTQTAGSTTVTSGTAILGYAGGTGETLNVYGGTVTGNIDMGGLGTTTADDGDAITFGNSSSSSISLGGTVNFDDMNLAAGTTTLNGVATGRNATSTLTVASGAVLVANANIASSGIRTINGELDIAAGKSVAGTGAVTIGTAGKIKIAVTDASTYGSITGSTFSESVGGTLQVDASGITSHITSGTRLHVFVGTGARGTFTAGTVLSDNSYIYKFTQEMPENDDLFSVDIKVTRENSFASTGNAFSTSSVGDALDRLGDNNGDSALNTIVTTLESYTNAAQVNAAVATLVPTNLVSGQTSRAVISSADASIAVIEKRMEIISNDNVYNTGIATGGKPSGNGMWGQVFGSSIKQDWRKDVAGYQAKLGGFSIGADTAIDDNTSAGVALAYGNTDATGIANETKVDSYQTSIYATHEIGNLYYEGLGSFSYNRYDTSRTLYDASVAKSNFNGQEYSAKTTAGYKVDMHGSLKFTPFVSAQYIFLTQDDYTETGSHANLHVKSDDINIFKTGFGTKLAYPIVDSGTTYTPRLSAAWYYDLVGDTASATSNFTSAAAITFASKGAEVARSEYKLGAGLDVLSYDNIMISLDYSWDSKQNFNAHTGELKASIGF